MRPLPLALLAVLALALGCSCGGKSQAPAPAPDAAEPPPEGTLPELEHLDVVLFFPTEDGAALTPEMRSVVKTSEPGTLAKQVLAELIAGPQGPGSARAIPESTVLRQVYLTADGTAYVDFGAELRSGLGGGSAAELMAVYAVVDSLAWSVPGVRKVGILIDGQQVETLNGHLDLTRALPPRQDLVRGSVPPRPSSTPSAPPRG